MKKAIFVLALFGGLVTTATAQTEPKKESNQKHMPACGEKGHTCTDACKKSDAKKDKMSMKEHQCTTACKDGHHMYMHGEKGHTCTAECKKTM